MLFTVSDPSCHAPSGILRLILFILLRDIDFSLFPSTFLNQDSPLWRPAPCFQHYGSLHQLPYFLFCIVASVLLVVWPDILILMFYISPCIWLIGFGILDIAESFLSRWLSYCSSWVISSMLALFRLGTADLSSAVSCSISAKASLIPTRFLAP